MSSGAASSRCAAILQILLFTCSVAPMSAPLNMTVRREPAGPVDGDPACQSIRDTDTFAGSTANSVATICVATVSAAVPELAEWRNTVKLPSASIFNEADSGLLDTGAGGSSYQNQNS